MADKEKPGPRGGGPGQNIDQDAHPTFPKDTEYSDTGQDPHWARLAPILKPLFATLHKIGDTGLNVLKALRRR